MSTTVTLSYFNGRGKGETVRMALAAAGVEFKEEFLESREQFLELSKDWIFGQAPCLEIDGMKIVQSGSILRYLAKRYQLNGSNREEETLVDQYFEGTRDFLSPYIPMGFMSTEEEILKGIQEKTSPKYLPIFERIISESGGSYLVGNKLSIADIGLLEVLLTTEDYFTITAFDEYPHLKKYYEDFLKATWMQHYKEKYRKMKNSKEYVAVVCKAVGRT